MRQRNRIEEKFGNLERADEMKVLFGEDKINLTDYKEETLPFKGAALVENSDIDTGETKHVLVLLDTNGKAYNTISPTFIDSFLTLAEWCRDEGVTIKTIKIGRGKSAKGRAFITCEPSEMEGL